jgi:conjugative relaxase-like TrwC/TraI family protein
VDLVLTISKLKRWSINYYIDTARAAETASRDVARAGGGLGEYYSEHETRTPSWLLAGDTHTVATLVGLTDAQRVGGEADAELVARWLDDGIAPNGARGRAFGHRGVHGFDLTFCAPKSVSLVRALRADDVVAKAIADAHTTALSEAMEYLAAHAGYARVHNPRTGEKDLVRLPGLAAIAYQHETSRCGDPHLHTHVIVPNRQARADGVMVSIDGTSLYHEAKAAGVIYQATLRRELHQSLGLEWADVDSSTGMAELAGVDRDTITAWSRRSTALREWAAHHLHVVDGPLSAAQLAAAQKATRPAKPEELAWTHLVQEWRADARGLHLDRAAFDTARAARRTSARTPTTPRASWPRPTRSTRPRSPAPTSSRSSARNYLSTPSAPPANCWNPLSTRSRCGSPRPGPRISAKDMSASPSTPSCKKKLRCSIWSTRAKTARCCGSTTTTPHTCRRTRRAPWKTSAAHPG